jgi:hypothetical protein
LSDVSATVVTAVIAAAAGLAGGLLTASANRSVERFRAHAAVAEKANERKLAALERFMLAVNAWIDILMLIEEQGWKGRHEEQMARVRERDIAYRQLLLLASDELFEWLTTAYWPIERRLRQGYVRSLRLARNPSPEDQATRREYSELLGKDMVLRFRPEVHALRNPVEDAEGTRGKPDFRPFRRAR